MVNVRGIFTRRDWNPVSTVIRYAIPRSRFCLAEASHVIAVDGDHAIEAHMLYGVRRVPLSVALKGLTIVRAVDYQVPNAEAGLAWARRLAEQKTKYDYAGALGLGLAPDRNWQDESNFFCFELFAGILDRAGRMIFSQNAHITGSMLLSIKP